jgi:hypothetical protein
MPRAVILNGTEVLRRYAVAWLYLAGFCVAEVWYALLPTHDQVAVAPWASTT